MLVEQVKGSMSGRSHPVLAKIQVPSVSLDFPELLSVCLLTNEPLDDGSTLNAIFAVVATRPTCQCSLMGVDVDCRSSARRAASPRCTRHQYFSPIISTRSLRRFSFKR